MSQHIKIKKGLDIPLDGKASARIETVDAHTIGIVPDDFEGHVWKNCIKEGDSVAVGTPLLRDKATGLLKIVSPVGGTVKEIRRGERRKILAIVVESGKSDVGIPEYDLTETADQIRTTLQESGIWVQMRQRPFDIVPDADSNPRDIYITAFDTAPLAPDLFSDKDYPAIEKGLEILGILSGRKPYIATRSDKNVEFQNGENIHMEGPHPAGNVGVQIAATRPVNKGETVWALNIMTVIRIGKLYTEGRADWSTKVALTGPELEDPHYVETTIGISIAELLGKSLESKETHLRVISGNVLTGKKVNPENGFLRYPYYQITVMAEGDDADEFMGWASMKPSKYSVKRTFPAFLRGLSKPFPFDARLKGGRRAMILSGEYDKVFPFDIYPEYLLRAIHANDIDRMEKLGIYEVAPEDFALPEFVDTSKQELQKTVRDSLDYLRREL